MSSSARSLRHVSRNHIEHLNQILNTTVTQKRLTLFLPDRAEKAQFAFRDGGAASYALLMTNYGQMELDLRQVCDVVTDDQSATHEIRVLSYRYALRVVGANDPLIRWEFIRFPSNADAAWSRYHVQGAIPLGIHDRNGVEANLNRWHLPSGPVAIEDVLRFCITDLGVRPLSDDWDQRLRQRAEQH